jgi:hypothetical protein
MTDSASNSQPDKKPPGSAHNTDPGTTIIGGENLNINLLTALLDAKVISPAQAQLLLADQEVTGMSIDEVLLARGWINEAKLDEVAPWRKKPEASEDQLRISAGSKNYQANFKQYRTLMERILGVSWD